MFEFHGWVALKVHDYDDTDPRVLDRHLAELVADVESRARLIEPPCSVVIGRAGALRFLDAHGVTERRFEQIIALYEWIAHRSNDSFGLLYVRDDEDRHRGGSFDNCFRVWRIARGVFD